MELNIADLFEALADQFPDRDAVISGDRRLSYAELDARANQLASFLRSRGVGAGDHIGLFLYNCAEFVEAMLAAFKLRAVPINVNYRYVEDELRYLLRNADMKVVVHQRELLPRLANATLEVPTLELLIGVDDGSDVDLDAYGAMDYEAAVAYGMPRRDFGPRSGDDLYIIYTGGTTGMPRGVMWRHKDVFYAGLQGGNPGGPPVGSPEELLEVSREAYPMAILPAAPFIHGAAQWSAWIAMFTGGKVLLCPGRSYDPRKILRMIEREQATTMTVVGDAMARPLVDALLEDGPIYDLSSLMVIASAGAVLSESVKNALQELMPNTMVLNNFGATETGHQGTSFPSEGGSGRPAFYMDETNTVLDEQLRAITPGSGIVGRLARSGYIPMGYYKDPVKTAENFVEAQGRRWVLPGDLATVEADGMITVFGRGSMCINSGGEKVFAEEVEEALKSHPAVLDAVVVGVPDARWGERVAAIIQTRPGGEVTLEIVDAHCRKHVAGYKVPRELHLVDNLVRHPSGKPDYRWAKSIATANRA